MVAHPFCANIIETGTWVNDHLDVLGPALLSLTGDDDRLRMHCLLANVNAQATETGVSFMWMGAWSMTRCRGRAASRSPRMAG